MRSSREAAGLSGCSMWLSTFPALLAASAFLVLGLSGTAWADVSVSFGPLTNFTVGTTPYAVATGDLNGDGDLDLAVANAGSNTVSVLLGNGSGGFAAASPVSVGLSPVSVAVGDLDNDGDLDIAVANSSANTVSVLLGNGSGGFVAASPVSVGSTPWSVAMGDLNGDGDLDLAVANAGSNTVSVLLGNGSGGFTAAPNVNVGGPARSVAIGDLNRDGDLDLAVAYGATVAVLAGNGSGGFAYVWGVAVGNTPLYVAIGDLDKDGDLDLAVANANAATVSILLGDGSGRLDVTPDVSVGGLPFSVAVGDLDNDGDLDLAVANGSSTTVSVLAGNGSGGFAAASNVSVGSHPYSVAMGDLEGDGDLDLVTANSGSLNASVLLNTTAIGRWAIFEGPTNYAVGSYPQSVAVGDLNRDGDLDLAVGNGSPTVSVLLGTGSGGFAAAPNVSVGNSPRSVAIGDLNRDGALDLAVPNGSSTVSVLLGDGLGGFVAASNVSVGSHPSSVAIGDLNQDGHLDLAVANRGSSSVSVLLGDGLGGFVPAPTPTVSVGDSPSSVAIGDLNRDGTLDLAVTNSNTTTVSVLLGNGSSGFAAASTVTVQGSPESVAIGDLNRDGNLDLAVANGVSDSVSVLLGNGSGGFAGAFNMGVGDFPYGVVMGDIDRNGGLDLAVASYYAPSNVSVLLGNGSGGFDGAPSASVDGGPMAVAIGDLDKDGDLDLVTANHDTSNVSVLLNRDTVAPGITSLSSSTHPSPSTWYANNDPAFSWSAASDVTGISGYSYVIDQAEMTDPNTTSEGTATSTVITDRADGIHYFHVRACDGAGNWGATSHRTVCIDASAPGAISGLSSSTHPEQTTWYTNNTPAFSWSAAGDGNGSGIAGYSYVLNGSAGTVPDAISEGSGLSKTYAAQGDGIHYFHVRAIDNMGSGGATSHYTVMIDASAPGAISGLSSSTHPVQTTWFANNTPAFSWSAAAGGGSGIAGYSYELTTSAGTVPDTNSEGGGLTATYAAQSDGIHYFHVRAIDTMGSGGATSHYTVMIDASTPTVSDNAPPGWSRTAVTVGLSPLDSGGSGVAKTEYRLAGAGAWLDTASNQFIVSATANDGAHAYEYRALDNAGNASLSGRCTVSIDTGSPTTGVAGALPGSWSRTPVSVTLLASDSASGVARTEYRLAGAAIWTPYATPFAVSAEGSSAYEFRSVDVAGNEEAARSLTVKIDSRKPTTKAYAASAKRGKKVKLAYQVSDSLPGCGQAAVTLKIYKGKKLKKTIKAGTCSCNAKKTHSWRCTLAKGRYTLKVYATDIAGNGQSKIGSAKLTVR